jgi:hypothetical protein
VECKVWSVKRGVYLTSEMARSSSDRKTQERTSVTTGEITIQITNYTRILCWFIPSLCVAGVALITLGWLWWRAWFPVDAAVAAAVCMAGVALGDICLHFAWQAWHLAKSAFTLRGRCGTSRHRPPLCVVGVALMPLGWLWWRAWFPVWRRGRRGSLRGKRGTWRHFAWRRGRRGSLRG